MKKWTWRLRYIGLAAMTGGLCAFNGCGLSDRQLSTIWESVLSTALNTVVSTALTSASGA
jgi:hypothetical protein